MSMIDLKSKTIFSRIPFINSTNTEKKKLRYWLGRLHMPQERIRRNNYRQDEQASTTENETLVSTPPIYTNIQDPIQSGIDENKKNLAIKKAEDRQIVNDLVKKSNRSIISISSLFPWDFFPSTIEIEESRVTFHFNQFLSSQSHSVDLKDISNVFIEYSLFFASLQIVSRTFIKNEIKIEYLNKTKAKKVQKIIEGLRTFEEHNINTSNYEIDELIAKIEELHSNNNLK